MAKQIYRYLLKNDYTDDVDQITEEYHNAKARGKLVALPEDLTPYTDQIFILVDSVFSDTLLPQLEDDRRPKTNPLNDNFKKKEFQELWGRINHKTVYRVEFDSSELVRKCIAVLNNELHITPLQYTIQSGIQNASLTNDQLKEGQGFLINETSTGAHNASVYSMVKYDLLGNLAENTQLTRRTIAEILSSIEPVAFGQFKTNPEHFISEATRLIKEQKATVIIERLSYDETTEVYDTDIFTAAQTKQDFTLAGEKLKNHIYDYAITDSKVEREFVKELDTSKEVVVYAKLPHGFLIPTPVGDYNPDWAISFKEGSVKHIYFVAETKGSMSTMQLRALEEKKIECARKFFENLNAKLNPEYVKYEVVTDYGKLMEVVGAKAAS